MEHFFTKKGGSDPHPGDGFSRPTFRTVEDVLNSNGDCSYGFSIDHENSPDGELVAQIATVIAIPEHFGIPEGDIARMKEEKNISEQAAMLKGIMNQAYPKESPKSPPKKRVRKSRMQIS